MDDTIRVALHANLDFCIEQRIELEARVAQLETALHALVALHYRTAREAQGIVSHVLADLDASARAEGNQA